MSRRNDPHHHQNPKKRAKEETSSLLCIICMKSKPYYMLKCHCFFCKKCFKEKVKSKLKKLAKKSKKSKVNCKFCGKKAKIRIYSCSNKHERDTILKFGKQQKIEESLKKFLEVEKVQNTNKKTCLRNLEKKSMFLENILNEILKQNPRLDVKKIKKKYGEGDKWSIIKKFERARKSSSVPASKKKKKGKRSKTHNGTKIESKEVSTRFRTKIQTKKGSELRQKHHTTNLGKFKLKGLMSNVQKSLVKSHRNSMNRSKLAKLICEMGERKPLNLKY